MIAIDCPLDGQERFRLLIKSEDDDTASRSESAAASESTEIGEIKEVLCRHRDTLTRAFTYYASLGAVANRGDGFSVCLEEYEDFCKTCKLPDEKSSCSKAVDLVDIFHTTNEEEGTGLVEDSEANAVNADRALMRFEWYQCIVRLAIAKYVHAGEAGRRSQRMKRIADVSEALEMLLTHDIEPNLPPEAKVVQDAFRERRFYTKPVHEALERNETMLKAIFDFYAASTDDDGTGPQVSGGVDFARTLNLSIEEWLSLLEDANLFDDAFTRREAVLCFCWAQPFVSDEVKRREKMIHLTYVDFCEALSRVTAFKPLPSVDLMKQYEARSVSGFFDQIERGEHEETGALERMRTAFDFREGPGDASSSTSSIRPALETLLALIFERLSTTDGVTRQAIKKRLTAKTDAKREAAEAARALAEAEKEKGLFGEALGMLGQRAGPD